MNQKRLIALIDANVLIPENLGSFLATCAYTGCITPVGATLHSFPMAIGTTRVEGLDAKLVMNLIRKVGLSQSQVAEMTKVQAIDKWNKYLSKGGQ
jgi:nitrate reductase beta subunit